MRLAQDKVKFVLAVAVLVTLVLPLSGCRKKTTPPAAQKPTAEASESGANSAQAGGGHIDWMTDWDKAKQTAQAEGKDLLIDFSGSDWCYWCKKLDAEVFMHSAFIDTAVKDFVFVLVDFPRDKSNQSETVQKQNERLSEEFGVQGFPTVYLAGPDGKPYAQTGYLEGGPAAYLAHLEELKKQK